MTGVGTLLFDDFEFLFKLKPLVSPSAAVSELGLETKVGFLTKFLSIDSCASAIRLSSSSCLRLAWISLMRAKYASCTSLALRSIFAGIVLGSGI